jgi:hypothetical protein
VDNCCKLVDDIPPKDGIVGVLDVDDVKSYDFDSHGCALAKGHVYISLPNSFDLLALKAYQGVH